MDKEPCIVPMELRAGINLFAVSVAGSGGQIQYPGQSGKHGRPFAG